MKVHLAVSKDTTLGGVPTHISATLCGREHSQNDGDNNSTEKQSEVTCGHCLKILRTPKHWALRKWNVCPETLDRQTSA